ncbi:hypothetical protein D9M68_695840 [compost metagenome]
MQFYGGRPPVVSFRVLIGVKLFIKITTKGVRNKNNRINRLINQAFIEVDVEGFIVEFRSEDVNVSSFIFRNEPIMQAGRCFVIEEKVPDASTYVTNASPILQVDIIGFERFCQWALGLRQTG